MILRRTVSLLAPVLVGSTLAAGCTMVAGRHEEFRTGDAPSRVVTPEEVAWREIDAGDVGRHVRFLASDSREGRGTPGSGLERSAAWLATEFRRAGLEPAGDDGGYLQYWPYERGAPGSDSVTIAGPDAAPNGETVVQVPNVVGRLAGSDLDRAEEYVIIVAHYDHLGVGEPDEDGDSIYNGADDNASGVAALVEVARAFGSLPAPTPRPVLFLAVSGEEHGLLGSTWFTTNPTVFLSEAVAALNMDMIGRNHPDSIGVVGYGHSDLGPLLQEVATANPRLGLAISPDAADDAEFFGRSDHFAFARRGIPAINLFSGLHDDYHTPSDEAGKVNTDKIARVARLTFLTAYRLASEPISLEWTDTGRAAIRR